MNCQIIISKTPMEILGVVLAGLLLPHGCAMPQNLEHRVATQTAPAPAAAPAETSFKPLPPLPVTETPVAATESPRLYPPVRLVSDEHTPVAPQTPPAPVRLARIEPRPADKPLVPSVLHVSETTFERHVLQSEVPVLVDFYASWCGPCKALAPRLEELAAETPQARVVKVNIDDSPDLANRYGVDSVPSLMVFKDGRIVARQSGLASKARLKAMLDL